MAGIAGVFHPTGQSLPPASLRTLIASQSRSSVGEASFWREDAVGLASVGSPVLQGRSLPKRRSEASSNCVVVGDCRLDNRLALVDRLIGSTTEAAEVADLEILLRAYERWGTECVEHLIGAFAFALYDVAKQQLFCARDQVGFRPFYYYFDKKRFVFSSELNSLLFYPHVDSTVNEERIADFLAGIHISGDYTFYKEIRRLPPGHFLVADSSGIAKHQYFSFTLPDELQLNDEEEYEHRFRQVFSQAVSSRLSSDEPVASLLSGGLDSSGVTSMAEALSHKPLHTFSAVFEQTPDVDERGYIEAVLAQGNYAPYFIDGHSYDPLAELPGVTSLLGKPSLGLSMSLYDTLLRSVADAGISNLLDGHGGDEALSRGHGYKLELAYRRRWKQLIPELKGIYGSEGLAWQRIFLLYWLRFGFMPDRVHWLLYPYLFPGELQDEKEETYEMISPRLAKTTDMKDRRRIAWRGRNNSTTEREDHFLRITDSLQPEILEDLNQMSQARGINVRFPYWDMRLVQFCLAVPSEIKSRNGVGRRILRRSLHKELPEKVRMRRDKAVFNESVAYAIANSAIDPEQALDCVVDAIYPYVDIDAARMAVQNVASEGVGCSPGALHATMQVLRLGQWLKNL